MQTYKMTTRSGGDDYSTDTLIRCRSTCTQYTSLARMDARLETITFDELGHELEGAEQSSDAHSGGQGRERWD